MDKKYKYSCLDCDWTREHTRPQRGVRCKPCATKLANSLRIDASKTTCPKCGDTKSYRATVCISCIDQSGENNGMYGKKNPEASKRNSERKSEEHWNWKGGIAKERSGKITAWAKAVKESNNNRCECCGYGNILALDAHHLISYKKDLSSNYDTKNGVCLCKNCHTVFHKIYGYGDNTEAQYIEFKEGYNG